MKRIAMVLIVLFAAVSLFAGGQECNMKAAKSVELTGTIAKADGEKTVFRTADGKSYDVCHKSKADLSKVSSDGTVSIKGKLVSCDEGGEELMIESVKKS